MLHRLRLAPIILALALAALSVPAGAQDTAHTLTVNFTGMDPHFGQGLYLRVVDARTGAEVDRDSVATMTADAFAVTLDSIRVDGIYSLDFWADLNGNNRYDSPPADHAWRILVTDVIGDTQVNFAHNTAFTDITWPYRVTLRVTGFTPHLNQTLHARLVEIVSAREVDRDAVVLTTPNMDVYLVGAEVGGSYYLDFWADHNKNGRWDNPSADHTWRVELKNLRGDSLVVFPHNTAFNPTGWPYMATLSVTGFTPHLGRLISARLVRVSTGREVSRDTVIAPSANFTLELPGLLVGESYRLDFFADHDGNGLYDSPPTDHAWRIDLANVQGDTTVTFAHNTAFTDIAWRYLVTVRFRNMTPHLNQDFHLRVVDASSYEEVYRRDVGEVPAPNFTIYAPGVALGQACTVDFYADHSNNDQYDAPPVDHAWRLAVTPANGDTTLVFTHNTVFTDVAFPAPTAIRPHASRPGAFTLAQNRPNPFNPSTAITFDVANPARVRIGVYNALGQHVRTLVDASYLPGRYAATWDGRSDSGADMASGIYFVRMTAPGFVQTRRIALVR